jgi:Flp pilus assembly protein TadD
MNGVLVRFAPLQIAEQQGEREKQFGLLNKVVDPDPQDLEARIKLGRILLTACRLDQAREIALQLTKVQALNSLIRFDLFASVLLASGERSMGCTSSKRRYTADKLINNSIFTTTLLFGR